jgi:hypothetical protein
MWTSQSYGSCRHVSQYLCCTLVGSSNGDCHCSRAAKGLRRIVATITHVPEPAIRVDLRDNTVERLGSERLDVVAHTRGGADAQEAVERSDGECRARRVPNGFGLSACESSALPFAFGVEGRPT